MKRNLYLLCLLLCVGRQAALAQNLVPNPSFETYVSCPTAYSQIEMPPGPPTSVAGWFRPSCGSSDYYNACNATSLNVPNNFVGYQMAHDGVAYVGGYMQFDFSGACREYVESLLTTTLTAGHEYYVSFWVNLVDKQPSNLSAVDHIGAYLGNGYINQLGAPQIDFVTPQIQNPPGNFISDTANWTKIFGTFIANGTENCIVLGNFCPYASQTSLVISGSVQANTPYYFMDDVCVFDMAGNSQSFDTSFCGLSSGSLQGRSTAQNFLWNTGDTTQSLVIPQPGTYWVKSLGECAAWVDTFHVLATGNTVKPQLGNDTALCFGKSLVLNGYNPAFTHYSWSTGDTSSALTINASGTYTLTTESACGNSGDTISIAIHPEIPAPPALDTLLCTGAGKHIRLPYNQTGLVWRLSPADTGSNTQPPVDASAAGHYKFYLSQKLDGCESDLSEINIEIMNSPLAELPGDTALCTGTRLALGQAQEGVQFLWNTGATTCCITIDTSGEYHLKAFNDCGISEDESTITFSDCDHCLWLSNAFSPNSDGRNDRFEVRNLCPLKQYRIRIYNRYGQTVFSGNNIAQQWDGTFNGKPCDVGTYFYYIEATPEQAGTPKIKLKGDITLIR